jgi:hypothetical protein
MQWWLWPESFQLFWGTLFILLQRSPLRIPKFIFSLAITALTAKKSSPMSRRLQRRQHNLLQCESMGGECSRIAEQFGLKYVPTMIILNNETKIYVGSNEVMRAIEVFK